MPAGLQTWDEYGRLRMDTSVRTANMVGQVYTNGVNGSLWTDTTKGTPFFYVTLPGDPSTNTLLPTVYFSGNTLIWTYIGGTAYTANYGVYITYGFF